MKFLKIVSAFSLLFLSSACSSDNVEYTYPEKTTDGKYSQDGTKPDSIFGSEGLTIFGGSAKEKTANATSIGVNSFLWRATIDTLSFMPLSSADPFGGIVITDWYSPPETPDERFKINAFILSKALRSDGIKVTVFKQIKNDKGDWVDSSLPAKVAVNLEDAILMGARKLRIAQMPKD